MAAKFAAEFIGTFFLVLAIGCAVIEPGAGALAPIAIGVSLMAMIYAVGHVSKAHFNPAITLAMWMRGTCSTADVPVYLAAEIAGAVAGAAMAMFLKGGGAAAPMSPVIAKALVAEVLFTFALAYVILHVATARATAGNAYFGLAIGFTVMAGAFAVGDISGAVFNPAVAIGISIMGVASWSNIWIYLVANFLGAGLAAFVFRWLHSEEIREEAG
jgi:aquaporin Z